MNEAETRAEYIKLVAKFLCPSFLKKLVDKYKKLGYNIFSYQES